MEPFSKLQERSNQDASLRFWTSSEAVCILQWLLAFWFSSYNTCETCSSLTWTWGKETRQVKRRQSSWFFLTFNHFLKNTYFLDCYKPIVNFLMSEKFNFNSLCQCPCFYAGSSITLEGLTLPFQKYFSAVQNLNTTLEKKWLNPGSIRNIAFH